MTKKKTKIDSPSSIKLVKSILLFDAVCKKLSVSRMHSLKFKGIVVNYLILRYGTRSSHIREEEKIISTRSSICALSFKLLDANNKNPRPSIRAYRVSAEANKALKFFNISTSLVRSLFLYKCIETSLIVLFESSRLYCLWQVSLKKVTRTILVVNLLF